MKTKSLERGGSFDSLYALVCGLFNKIKDKRENNASYALSDLLKMGFAMFSLKSPSLLNFVGRTKSEDSNLGGRRAVAFIRLGHLPQRMAYARDWILLPPRGYGWAFSDYGSALRS